MAGAPLAAWLAELDERNADNVARTESYLELYAWTRAHPPELPWLLMAHLVSRNAGYLMTDLRRVLDDARTPKEAHGALENLFHMLERANFLIFWDAWWHVAHHLGGQSARLAAGRTSAFIRAAWPRHEAARDAAGGAVDAALERALVVDLVHNEQHTIERRVVHHARFAEGMRAVAGIEMAGREKPIHFPVGDADIKVGRFADVERRIATGARIFDEVLADRARRDELYAWALAHPHTGSREVYGGRPGPTLREAWPAAAVRAACAGIHAPAEPDPLYP
jgi:hypothetical protein